MPQKSRSELKQLFQTGDKPSQQDFADFIESTLNVKDDGIEKPSGANTPLKITAQDTDEKLLDFYAGETKTWSINQKPGENKIGLNISNAGGSKLFIDSSNGNVGLSIDQPTAKLHIQQTGNEDALRIDELKGTTPFLIDKDGNVGIGTTTPTAKLEVSGDLKVNGKITGTIDTANITSGILSVNRIPNLPANKITSGTISEDLTVSKSLSFGASTRQMINLWNQNYGIGIQGSTQYFRTDKNFAWYKGGTHNDAELNAGTNGTVQMVIRDGNVGIGITNPSAKLEVSGDLKVTSDLHFGININQKFIVHTRSGRGDFLQITHDDEKGNWVWQNGITLTRSGNVGIGITNPGAKLEVSGDLKVTGAITPSAGNRENNGIMFPKDPGGGAGDAAWIRYYSRNPDSTDVVAKEQTTFEIGTSNDITDHIALMPGNGNVGIGTTIPGAKLEVNGTLKVQDVIEAKKGIAIDGDLALKGVMSGTGNDYQKAQFTLSGGGKVTWEGPGGRLKWTQRFIAISMQRGVTFLNGHINILQPTKDIPANNVFDGKARSANADGVILNSWEALYAVHTIGGDENAVSYHIVHYTKAFEAPSNWLLVAVVNSDNQSIKLGTGLILNKNTSSTNSSPIPVGVIMMWSGQVANIPDGWVLCNGQNGTPDLRDRFIVAAGNSYNPGLSGEPDQHSHSVTPPSKEFTTNSAGNHTHRFPSVWYKRDFDKGGFSGIDTGGDDIKQKTTESSGNHSHTVRVEIGSFNSASSSGLNRPKWYALCFIMKL